MRPVAIAILVALAASPGEPASAETSTPSPAAGTSTRPSAALCGSGPLEILLTNDDGYEAPGIRALYAGLRAAGHRVRLVAPIANASGSSSSFTWTNVTLRRDPSDPDVAGIAGSPATAVVFGAAVLYPPGVRPDLIVSGINNRANTGALLALSGTIGAALAGTILLDPPVPGIAVNAEREDASTGQTPLPRNHLAQVSAHLTRLIEATRGWFCKNGRLQRPTLVLNVNYPARPISGVAGITVADQGHASNLRIRFEPAADGTYAASVSEPAADVAGRDSDTELLRKGYVTVTPLHADLEAGSVPMRDLQRRLKTLSR